MSPPDGSVPPAGRLAAAAPCSLTPTLSLGEGEGAGGHGYRYSGRGGGRYSDGSELAGLLVR